MLSDLGLTVPWEVKHRMTISSSKSTAKYIPKRTERRDSDVCTLMLAVLFTTARKTEASKISTNREMLKQNVICVCVYIYKGIFFSLKKKCRLNICYNMNESWTLLSEISQTNTVRFHVYEVPRIGTFTNPENRIEISSGWREGRVGSDCNRHRPVWDDGEALVMACAAGCPTL